jgi:hypothetical protein
LLVNIAGIQQARCDDSRNYCTIISETDRKERTLKSADIAEFILINNAETDYDQLICVLGNLPPNFFEIQKTAFINYFVTNIHERRGNHHLGLWFSYSSHLCCDDDQLKQLLYVALGSTDPSVVLLAMEELKECDPDLSLPFRSRLGQWVIGEFESEGNVLLVEAAKVAME